MHAEERQRRIGDRVDECSHEVRALWLHPQVGAPKRNDARIRVRSSAGGHAVGPGTRAGEDVAGLVGGIEGLHAEAQLTACGDELLPQGVGNTGEVDNAGGRGPEGRDPADVGLALTQRLAGQPLESRDAVREATTLQLVESGKLGVRERDDQLAAAFHRDRVLVTELVHGAGARCTELGLQRPRRVVDAGVNDA